MRHGQQQAQCSPLKLSTRLSRIAWRISADAAPKGEAHGNFALAADGADQHQAGEVDTGNEKHDGDREEQCAQQGPRFCMVSCCRGRTNALMCRLAIIAG